MAAASPPKIDLDFYIKFARPLIFNLADAQDRVLAASWVKKIKDESSGSERLRTDYIKLLLFALQRPKLIGIFSDDPTGYETLQEFPEEYDLNEMAKLIMEKEKKDRMARIRRQLKGEIGDLPPYSTDCSSDFREYVAAQDIPGFGVHCYYAISKDPVNTWTKLETGVFPKMAKSAVDTSGPTPPGMTGISDSCICSPPESPDEEPSECKNRLAKLTQPPPPKKKKKLGRNPPTSPLGKVPEPEERAPPLWGTNLFHVKAIVDNKMTVGIPEPSPEVRDREEEANVMKDMDFTMSDYIRGEIGTRGRPPKPSPRKHDDGNEDEGEEIIIPEEQPDCKDLADDELEAERRKREEEIMQDQKLLEYFKGKLEKAQRKDTLNKMAEKIASAVPANAWIPVTTPKPSIVPKRMPGSERLYMDPNVMPGPLGEQIPPFEPSRKPPCPSKDPPMYRMYEHAKYAAGVEDEYKMLLEAKAAEEAERAARTGEDNMDPDAVNSEPPPEPLYPFQRGSTPAGGLMSEFIETMMEKQASVQPGSKEAQEGGKCDPGCPYVGGGGGQQQQAAPMVKKTPLISKGDCQCPPEQPQEQEDCCKCPPDPSLVEIEPEALDDCSCPGQDMDGSPLSPGSHRQAAASLLSGPSRNQSPQRSPSPTRSNRNSPPGDGCGCPPPSSESQAPGRQFETPREAFNTAFSGQLPTGNQYSPDYLSDPNPPSPQDYYQSDPNGCSCSPSPQDYQSDPNGCGCPPSPQDYQSDPNGCGCPPSVQDYGVRIARNPPEPGLVDATPPSFLETSSPARWDYLDATTPPPFPASPSSQGTPKSNWSSRDGGLDATSPPPWPSSPSTPRTPRLPCRSRSGGGLDATSPPSWPPSPPSWPPSPSTPGEARALSPNVQRYIDMAFKNDTQTKELVKKVSSLISPGAGPGIMDESPPELVDVSSPCSTCAQPEQQQQPPQRPPSRIPARPTRPTQATGAIPRRPLQNAGASGIPRPGRGGPAQGSSGIPRPPSGSQTRIPASGPQTRIPASGIQTRIPASGPQRRIPTPGSQTRILSRGSRTPVRPTGAADSPDIPGPSSRPSPPQQPLREIPLMFSAIELWNKLHQESIEAYKKVERSWGGPPKGFAPIGEYSNRYPDKFDLPPLPPDQAAGGPCPPCVQDRLLMDESPPPDMFQTGMYSPRGSPQDAWNPYQLPSGGWNLDATSPTPGMQFTQSPSGNRPPCPALSGIKTPPPSPDSDQRMGEMLSQLESAPGSSGIQRRKIRTSKRPSKYKGPKLSPVTETGAPAGPFSPQWSGPQPRRLNFDDSLQESPCGACTPPSYGSPVSLIQNESPPQWPPSPPSYDSNPTYPPDFWGTARSLMQESPPEFAPNSPQTPPNRLLFNESPPEFAPNSPQTPPNRLLFNESPPQWPPSPLNSPPSDSPQTNSRRRIIPVDASGRPWIDSSCQPCFQPGQMPVSPATQRWEEMINQPGSMLDDMTISFPPSPPGSPGQGGRSPCPARTSSPRERQRSPQPQRSPNRVVSQSASVQRLVTVMPPRGTPNNTDRCPKTC